VRATNAVSSGTGLSKSSHATFTGSLALARSAGRSPRPARLWYSVSITGTYRFQGGGAGFFDPLTAAARLRADDVLADSMRGRSTNWIRIRINLRNVPEGERPPDDPPEPDYDAWPAAAHG
jgi:hypothetical protein